MGFVIWLYFLGPISCALAAPAHVLTFFFARRRVHLYSVCASAACCAATWAFFSGVMLR